MKNDDEYLILVDAEDRETGIAEKLDAHRAGALHRAFSIIIWDNHGRMLLQKRAATKYHSGGLWTNACCGHPRPGEAVEAAALRRLDEEMGIICALQALGTLTYHAAFDNGLTEHEIVHVYSGVFEGAIAPEPSEADGFQWCALADVQRDAAAMPERYSVWFRKYLDAEWPLFLARAGA